MSAYLQEYEKGKEKGWRKERTACSMTIIRE